MNDRPLRVVILAQDDGGRDEFNSLDDRTKALRATAEMPFSKKTKDAPKSEQSRNPHMKGTTSALRIVFGAELGTDHDGEMIDVNGERIHITRHSAS